MDDREIELKLRVTPADLARIEALPDLAQGFGGRPAVTLESVYYDTPDLRLRRRDVTLRVRRQEEGFLQTVKSGRDRQDGLTSRGEWEVPVPGPAPDLAALSGSPARGHLGPLTEAGLKPLFESRIRRRVCLLDGGGDGDAVEMALDSGEIRTPEGAVLPVSEVELELKRGEPRVLYELAQRLAREVPVRIETRSKSDRGYLLASGGGPEPVKAERVVLDPDATVEEALEAIMQGCLGHLLANEAPVLERRDPEGIHQMRVALRRLRSALVLFRPVIPDGQGERLGAEVKWLAGELGDARDWDVFLADLLEPVERALPGDPALGALRAAAEKECEAGYRRALAALGDRRCAALLLEAGNWLESRAWRRQDVSEEAVRLFSPIRDLADPLLEKRHRKAVRRGRGFSRLDSAQRHELRIALKKLRYACGFFRSLHEGKALERYMKQLSALQDSLGHLNDVATAARLMGRLAGKGGRRTHGGAAEWRVGAGIVVGWHARGLRDLEPELAKSWKRFSGTGGFWSRNGS